MSRNTLHKEVLSYTDMAILDDKILGESFDKHYNRWQLEKQ